MKMSLITCASDMPANASPKKKPASVCQNSKNASRTRRIRHDEQRHDGRQQHDAGHAFVDEWVNWMSFLYRA